MSHKILEKLVNARKARIIFVYGLARSGSTITQIAFTPFVDLAIHEPFTALLQNKVTQTGAKQLEFDQDIYEAGCELIVNQISNILKHKKQAQVLIKEVSSFFSSSIWEQWSKIPEFFLLTIRDPHEQYFSRLSQISSVWNLQQSVPNNPVLEQAAITESIDLSTLKPFWEGTIVDYNQKCWQLFKSHTDQIKCLIQDQDKTMAVLDLTLLRRDPEHAIDRVIKQLNLNIDQKIDINKNLHIYSQQKVLDIRDPNRLTVFKARHSQEITPLLPGEDMSPYDLPLSSRKHIWQMIPLYLDMLYTPEQVAMPSFSQLDCPVNQGNEWTLAEVQPFIAYAIANFYSHQNTDLSVEALALVQKIMNAKTPRF